MSLRALAGELISMRNWNGLAISSPDVSSSVALQNYFQEKLQLYVLHERRKQQDLIYVGETKGRIQRLREGRRFVSRNMDSPQAILFFSKNPVTDRKMLRYMEGRIYYALRRSDKLAFCNTYIPLSSQQVLNTNEIIECEKYLSGVWKVLIHLKIIDRPFLQKWVFSSHNQYEMRMEFGGDEIFADAEFTEAGFVVKKGSPAKLPKNSRLDDRHLTREMLIDEGILEFTESGRLTFCKDYKFSNPYSAACVINGSNSSPKRWVRRGTGLPLEGPGKI